jgi:hypothetical protein
MATVTTSLCDTSLMLGDAQCLAHAVDVGPREGERIRNNHLPTHLQMIGEALSGGKGRRILSDRVKLAP